MRNKLLIIVSIVFLFSILVASKSYAEYTPPDLTYCSAFHGTFSASHWPAGAKITVSCEGDTGNHCHGDRREIEPGEYQLENCSCGEYVQTGVVKVENIPDGCTLTDDLGQYIAANHKEISADFGIDCTPPVPACNEACTDNNSCNGEVNGCTQCLPDTNSNTGKSCQPPAANTPPPPPGPACNTSCTKDSECAGAKDSCTICSPSTKKCTPPGTPIPSTTPGPACNTSCTKDSECAGAKDSCTDCNETTKKCVPALTPTPPAACNTSCTKDSECAGAKDSCTDCNETTKKCVPAPTPTPVFNENWCTCDGIDSTPPTFFPGDKVVFNGYGKVEAPYLTRAKVESITFRAFRGQANIQNEIVPSSPSQPIPAALISQSSSVNRYKSSWNFTIPGDAKQGEIFRIQAKVKCAPQNVLGAAVHYEPSLIDRVVQFIGYMFGFSAQPAASDYQPVVTPPTAAMNVSPSPAVLAAKQSLQIDSFYEAKYIEKSCSVVRFKFGN